MIAYETASPNAVIQQSLTEPAVTAHGPTANTNDPKGTMSTKKTVTPCRIWRRVSQDQQEKKETRRLAYLAKDVRLADRATRGRGCAEIENTSAAGSLGVCVLDLSAPSGRRP